MSTSMSSTPPIRILYPFYAINPTTGEQASTRSFSVNMNPPVTEVVMRPGGPRPSLPNPKKRRKVHRNEEEEGNGDDDDGFSYFSSRAAKKKQSASPRKRQRLAELQAIPKEPPAPITLLPPSKRPIPTVLLPPAFAFDLSTYRQITEEDITANTIEGKNMKKRRAQTPYFKPVANAALTPICHQCRNSKSLLAKMECAICNIRYCQRCVVLRYAVPFAADATDWKCPRCFGICNCSLCLRKGGLDFVLDDPEISSKISQLARARASALDNGDDSAMDVCTFLAQANIIVTGEEWVAARSKKERTYFIGERLTETKRSEYRPGVDPLDFGRIDEMQEATSPDDEDPSSSYTMSTGQGGTGTDSLTTPPPAPFQPTPESLLIPNWKPSPKSTNAEQPSPNPTKAEPISLAYIGIPPEWAQKRKSRKRRRKRNANAKQPESGAAEANETQVVKGARRVRRRPRPIMADESDPAHNGRDVTPEDELRPSFDSDQESPTLAHPFVPRQEQYYHHHRHLESPTDSISASSSSRRGTEPEHRYTTVPPPQLHMPPPMEPVLVPTDTYHSSKIDRLFFRSHMRNCEEFPGWDYPSSVYERYNYAMPGPGPSTSTSMSMSGGYPTVDRGEVQPMMAHHHHPHPHPHSHLPHHHRDPTYTFSNVEEPVLSSPSLAPLVGGANLDVLLYDGMVEPDPMWA